MNSTPFSRRAALALLACIVLVGCGGGGGDGATPPDPATTLGAKGGSVVSADGKVTVSVGANALQANTTVTMVPAVPDTTNAADPSLVAGTTYTYTAPDIQVPDQVLIEIASPAAAVAAAVAGKKALALPPAYVAPPTCLVNSALIASPVHNIWVAGTECPASPAPACVKVLTSNTGGPHALCAPAQEIIFIPGAPTQCPGGYHEVTGEAAYAGLASLNGLSRLCKRDSVATPPVLGQSGSPSALSCSVQNGKFVCVAARLPSGTFSVLWDREPPPLPTFDLSTNGLQETFIDVNEVGGLPGKAIFRIRATDPQGLGAVELVEATAVVSAASSASGHDELQIAQRWRANPALFAGGAVRNFLSEVIEIPYTLSDPARRRFFIRAYDVAGNSAASTLSRIIERRTGSISINTFTVTPATVPLPGGPVTVSWSILGADAASIDQGIGALAVSNILSVPSSGSRVVNVSANTTFTLVASEPTRNSKTATATVTIGPDINAPAVTLGASPSGVVAPGSTLLTATASDAVGVTRVEFYRGATLIATDTTAPYEHLVSFTAADIGNVSFTAKAHDAANNSSTSTAVVVTVGADVTPPTVSLSPSPSTVLVPGSTALVANVTDNIGVTRVEFYRGSTLINTDTAAPFQYTVNLSTADIGSIGFTAKAFDAQNNATTSAVATVTASAPATGDTYASPSGVDSGNTSCAQATPCLSINKAASLAQAGRTVWLSDGTYTPTSQPTPISLPAGLTLRALTPGMVVLQQSIALAGNATVVGLTLDRGVAFAYATMLSASSGSITLEGLKIIGRLNGPAFSFSGSAQVTMAPGNLADYTDQLDAQGGAGLVALSGSARLTINGGSFTGTGIGTGSNVGALAVGFAAFQVTGNSQLTINNATIQVKGNGIFLDGTSQVTLNSTTLTASMMNGPGAGIGSLAGTPSITLTGSTISGFKYGPYSASIVIGAGNSLINATLSMNNTVLSGSDYGLAINGGTGASSTTITGTGVQIKNNTLAGAFFLGHSSVDINGGEVSGNGTQDATIAGSTTFYGGLWFGNGSLLYTVKLRNLMVVNNRSLLTGNTNVASNSGITLGGTAASNFDLGTAASPGSNTFTGNITGNQTSGLNVVVAAGVVVNAVGNTFIANTQGSNAQGKFVLGASPCGVASCLVTTGTGANYRVGSGSLKLAE